MLRRLNVFSTITKRLASTVAFSPKQVQQSLFTIPSIQQQNATPNKWLSVIQNTQIERSSILNQLPKIDVPETTEGFHLTSVLRKRRLKMKKHKLRKRRKAQRALKIKIGK